MEIRQVLMEKKARLQEALGKIGRNLEQVRGALAMIEELLVDLDTKPVTEAGPCTEVQAGDGLDASH